MSDDHHSGETATAKCEPLIRVPAATAHPEDVYTTLSRTLSPRDRSRRHQRKSWISGITAWVFTDDNNTTALRLTTLAHDISHGGLCFVYPHTLPLGAQVRIRFDTLAGNPVVEGRIVNCIYVGAERNRVGVEFEESRGTRSAPIRG